MVLGARDLRGGRVALKVATAGDSIAGAQLAREESALRDIGAPATPALLGSGSTPEGAPWIALERVELPTLAAKMDAVGGVLPRNELGQVVAALLDALDAVHARGWAHLDLKPENVFIGPEGARLIDFGVARQLTSPRREASIGFAGTAEYMSPEQCEERPDLDARADLYAAAVILYEMLAGRPPFVGAPQQIRDAHAAARPPRPSAFAEVPDPLERVVLRGLAKERARRFQSAGEMKSAFAAAFAEPSAPAAAPPVAPRDATPSLERRRVGLVFFSSSAGAGEVQTRLRGLGGELGHASPPRYAGIFAAESGQDPVRRAFRAAQGVTEGKLAVRCLVDVAIVGAQRRRDGQVRWIAPELAAHDRYPREAEDPVGPLATAAAADALAEIGWEPVAGRPGVLSTRPVPGGGFSAATVVQVGAGPLVGRGDVLRSLRTLAAQACEGHAPSVSSVVAEPGHGKTHLAAALAQELRQKLPEAELLDLRAREPVAGDADETLRALVLRALDPPSTTGADGVRARFLGFVGRAGTDLWPALALALRLVSPEETSVRALAAAPGVLRLQSVRAVGEVLRARARARPLCILLDDAQFADDAALDALEYAALAEARAPLFVCALGRPSFSEARPGFGERAARRETHRLGPLDPARATELCRRLLAPAENVPAAAVERLVQRTQGVPLLLVELVRGLKRDGLVRRRARGDSWFIATDELDKLPDSPLVEWLAEREMGALPRELAAHARLASLLGAEFGQDEIEGIVAQLDSEGAGGDFPLDAGVATRRLLATGLLLATRAGGYRLRHALVRDAVARSLPAAHRLRIHAAAARFYRETKAVPEARRLPLLAMHAAEAGLREEAAALFLELAAAARERHAYLDAEHSYTTALSLLPEPDRRRRLDGRAGRGSMRYRLGRYEDAIEDFTAARELARSLDDAAAEVEILIEQATALDWTSDYARSAALVSEAESVAALARAQAPLVEARLLLGKALALFRSGKRAEACTGFEEAARRAEAVGDAAYETLIIALVMLEYLLPEFGRLDEAERIATRAVALARERGDRLHLGAALNNRRVVLVARKDLAGALQDQRTLMQMGRELGVLIAEYFGELNLSELHYQSRDLERAAEHARRALEIEERHPEVASRPLAILRLARIEAYRGRDGEARALLARLEQVLRKARDEGRASGALTDSEEVLVAMVDLATRDASDEEWDALLERSARVSIEQEPIEVADLRGVSALRRGRIEAAKKAYAEAASRAARIPHLMDERLRLGLSESGIAS